VTVDLFEVADREERIRLVREATLGGRGVDVAIECAGVPSAVTEGIECLRNGGRYAELGHFSDVGAIPVNPWKHLLANNITLVGSSGYMAKHFRRALDILERGAFPFELLVTHKLPLARAAEGMLALTPEGGWQVDGIPAAKITVAPSG
jgi:threonine dehydrogenase-like Zn-dependent dehydrogenase